MPSRRQLIIGLDLDDTLMPSTFLYHQPMWECGKIISKALGHKSPYPPRLLDLQHTIDAQMVGDMEFSVIRFPLSWVRTYHTVAKAAGLNPDSAIEQELLQTAMRFAYGPFRPFPGANDVLVELRQAGHIVHLITSGDIGLQNFKIDEAGFRPFFTNDRLHIVGASKRATMLEVFGPNPNHSVMVGDSPGSDIETAQSLELGVTTVLIPSETWKFAQSRNGAKADFTIQTINELPAVINQVAQR